MRSSAVAEPSNELWRRINDVIIGEDTDVVIITMIAGMCELIKAVGITPDGNLARAHLAAVVLSPDDGPPASLLPQVPTPEVDLPPTP